jgi:hypothetical protein
MDARDPSFVEDDVVGFVTQSDRGDLAARLHEATRGIDRLFRGGIAMHANDTCLGVSEKPVYLGW